MNIPSVKTLHPNLVQTTDIRGNEFYFSYGTLIAFRRNGEHLIASHNVWTKTTGRHLGILSDKQDRVSNEVFNALLEKSFME